MERQKNPGAFFRDSALMLTNNVLVFGFALLSGVLIARGLGPAGKGIYSIALLFPTIIASLGSLGLNHASIYFLNKGAFTKKAVAGSALLYTILAGAFLTLLIVFFSREISGRFLGGAGAAYIIAASPLLVMLMLTENIYYFFLASRDIKNISVYTAIRTLLHLLLVACFYFSSSLTIFKTLASQSAALFAALIFGVYALNRRGIISGVSGEWAAFRQMLSFGLKQHLGTASQLLNYRIDLFIAAAFLSAYDVGIYSVSVSMAELLWYIANSASQILYAKTAASEGAAADSFTPEVARHVLFLTLISALILGAVAKPVTSLLFGPGFLPAADTLRLLLPGVVFLSLSKILGSDISARGYPHYNSTASVSSLAAAVVLNLALIPAYGLRGAAAATSLSYFINAAVMLYFFKKISATRIAAIFIPDRKDADFYLNRLSSLFKGAA